MYLAVCTNYLADVQSVAPTGPLRFLCGRIGLTSACLFPQPMHFWSPLWKRNPLGFCGAWQQCCSAMQLLCCGGSFISVASPGMVGSLFCTCGPSLASFCEEPGETCVQSSSTRTRFTVGRMGIPGAFRQRNKVNCHWEIMGGEGSSKSASEISV